MPGPPSLPTVGERVASRWTAPVGRWSMSALFALSHLPLVLFTLAIVAVSLLVASVIRHETAALAADLAAGRFDPSRVHALGLGAQRVWFACLAGLLALGVVAAALTVLVHRSLSARVRRITRYAGDALDHGLSAPLVPVADDALGELERALGRIVARVAQRDASLHAAMDRQQRDADVQQALAMVDTEAEALETAADVMALLAPSTAAELLLADSSRAHLRLAVASPAAPAPGCAVLSPDSCVAVRSGKVMAFEDGASVAACPKLRRRAGGPRAAVCAPVSVMGRTVGVLHAAAPPSAPLSPREVEALACVATHVGARLGVLRVLRSRELMAETDGLTSLVNRRSFEEKGALLVASAPEPVAVVMGDLDHFKQLNDGAGHEAGDRALRVFAHTFRDNLRPCDLVARYGGEEFVAVLPTCSGAEARRALDRVREALATALARGTGPRFTVSFGVAVAPDDGRDLHELLHAADAALYRAKRAGRNRVCVTGEPETAAEPATELAGAVVALRRG